MATRSVFISLLILFMISVPALSRQVVTDADREWAHKVVSQEKELSGSFSENTIGVLYFQNATGDSELDPLQKGLAIMLISDLSSLEGYQVVERPRLQALIEELQLHSSGLVDEETMVRLQKLLQAHWLIGGDFTGTKRMLHIQGRKLDIKHERPERLKAIEGAIEELFRLEKQLLAQILNAFALKVSPKEQERILAIPSIDYRAMWYFFKGIQASDKKNYYQAAEMYKRSLETDPKCHFAQYALDELFSLGLIRGVVTRKGFLRGLKHSTTLTDTLTPKYPVKRLRKPGEIPQEEAPPEEPPPEEPPPDSGGGEPGYPWESPDYP